MPVSDAVPAHVTVPALCAVYLFQKVTQGVERNQVCGVGFDATCSLVVLDQSFQPVPVNQDGE